jgi:DNA-binding NarL/FixJ family response regulator
VQFAGHVLRHASQDGTAPPPELTEAERVVLDLLRRGLTNRAIAELRGTSTHTVAKQVRALLRKTGSPSRRALLAAAGTHNPETPQRSSTSA